MKPAWLSTDVNKAARMLSEQYGAPYGGTLVWNSLMANAHLTTWAAYWAFISLIAQVNKMC